MSIEEKNTKSGRSFGDLLFIIMKWRRLIVINFIAICLIAAAIALLLPKTYLSTCSILPPEDEGFSFGAFSSLLGSFIPTGDGGSMKLPLLATPSDVFASILNSRSVQKVIIEKYDLMERFGLEFKEEAYLVLSNMVEVSVGDEGIIYLAVETQDPELSLNIANDYVAELDRINREKRKTKAFEMRQFIEDRLASNKLDLAKAENALKEFQEEHQLVSVEEQTRATLAIAAELIAELRVKEVELGVMRSTFNSAHQQVRMLNRNIDELKKQIENLGVGGLEGSNGDFAADPSIPISRIPSLGLAYFRLLREVKIQEAIFELLMQQYEQAKLQEKKDTSTIRVLDAPQLAEMKNSPQRRLMVMIAGFLSLAFSLVLILVIEYLQKLRTTNPAEFDKYQRSLNLLKTDLNKLRGKKQG